MVFRIRNVVSLVLASLGLWTLFRIFNFLFVLTSSPGLPRQPWLQQYENMCIKYKDKYIRHPTKFCPCLPSNLGGQQNLTHSISRIPIMKETKIQFGVKTGGSWAPATCVSVFHVAIIIPFRDRMEHLSILLYHLHAMLQRQSLKYRVFVVEQNSPHIFNKASIMNVGFLEANKMEQFNCFIFHDVDMLPEDDRNMYTCVDAPLHLGAYVNKFNYSLPYPKIFGGATAFLKEHFERINGFSNTFYGWGGEDDDIYQRLMYYKIQVNRRPKDIARYYMLEHKRDYGNPLNEERNIVWKSRTLYFNTDGLNSVKYKICGQELRPVYTWICVNLTMVRNKAARKSYSTKMFLSFICFYITILVISCY